MLIDLPYFDASLDCITRAAITYHVPAKLIISVLAVERGKVGKTVKNKNGTDDIGPMQINSSWLPTLKKYNITQADIQFNACTNVMVGTWILSKKIAHEDDLIKGIGDYNSHTGQFNKRYSDKVRISYTKINYVLNKLA